MHDVLSTTKYLKSILHHTESWKKTKQNIFLTCTIRHKLVSIYLRIKLRLLKSTPLILHQYNMHLVSYNPELTNQCTNILNWVPLLHERVKFLLSSVFIDRRGRPRVPKISHFYLDYFDHWYLVKI